MNNELLYNRDFIRCSTLVAELLMKYKKMETQEIEMGGESEEGSPSSFFAYLLLKISLLALMLYSIGDYY